MRKRRTKRKTKKTNNRVPKNRTRYEGELVKLIGTRRRDTNRSKNFKYDQTY